MGKDPAVLFYTSDFLSGTSFFSMEEVGQYITLLCQQHQLKSIPESQIIKICGSLNSIVVSKFKKDGDGTYYNERMRVEADKRSSFCESRRKSIKNRYVRTAHVEHTKVRMENENENRNDNEVKNRNAFKKPTIEEVKDYCDERKNSVDPQSFLDFYESKGWMIGKNKMKDWQAAVRTWEKNKKDKPQFKQFGRQNLTMEELKEQAERIDLSCSTGFFDHKLLS